VSGHEAVFLRRLAQSPAVLVRVDATQGSVPREAGAWMAVFADAVVGTIGGGHLEHQAMAMARSRLQGAAGEDLVRFVLGPSLGQCCGGALDLRFDKVGPEDVPRLLLELRRNLQPVALFGGGHVGHALAQVLASLPFSLSWFDSRDGIFPQSVPAHVACEHSDPVQGAVRGLPANSKILIMSFSHAEDLDIVAECLRRQRERADLAFIGLIGSKTKWATFRHRLASRGFSDAELAQVSCPIGLPGLEGKEPEVIAVSVAAQLLLQGRR
jgi:xanthine dehydrogenase accessory factor